MCKYEKYGNCDKETKDQEFCIFHKPNKSKEEAREFYKKFLDKFKHRVEEIEVRGEKKKRKVFVEDVDCRGYVFPPGFGIEEGSVFKENAFFDECIFEGEVWFYGVTFKKHATFFNAVFKGRVIFDYSKCEGFTSFEFATFEGDELYRPSFKFVEFGEVALFDNATFRYGADFDYVVFNGDADFNRVTASKTIGFLAEFKKDAKFGWAKFEELAFGRIEDSEYLFGGKLDFSHTRFERILIDIPSGRSKWPNKWFKLPEAEAEACRIQRISYEKEGRKDDADRMFVRERRALRRWRIKREIESWRLISKVKDEKKLIQKLRELKHDDLVGGKLGNELLKNPRKTKRKLKLKLLYLLFKASVSNFIEWLLADLTCKYGTSWIRAVILWISVVLVLFPSLYWLTQSIPNAKDFRSCLYFSIVTATTLGYGDLYPVGIGRFLASIEAIFGTFMWAVFLAVFARKYMR